MESVDTESVYTKEELAFDTDTYEWGLKLFHIAEKHIGLNLHVDVDDEVLENGQIFVFNHFARFETVIPVYIFYKRLKRFTRTIADHELFEFSEGLSRFLRGAGAVPNNMPGLLPFLAAELLKGHKVVIFPEGRMVKSKQVMDDKGRYLLFGTGKQPPRKHHTGAAVLALTLDLFKWRIRDLFASGDNKRLDHWCQALDFPDHESLRKSVEKPTLIVPGTITFSPVRVDSNFLSRAASLVSRDMPDSLLEEAIIEGNILLKNTDMDIRFGEAIQARSQWTWFDTNLLRRYFLSIHSLDDFFGLRDRTESWRERLLGYLLYRETNRIRDEYILGLYRGITVNTAHLAALLVFCYLEAGRREVPQALFHRALYLTVKTLQGEPDIHLHRSLQNPDEYRFLYRGISERFAQFMMTATSTGLVEIDGDQYRFSEKLLDHYDFHEVRLANPLHVSANEAAPVPGIKPAVSKATRDAEEMAARDFACRLWDDERRSFIWNKEVYSEPKYQEVNQFEAAGQRRGPFLLVHDGEPRVSVLLVHGLLASPAELSGYGNHLYEKGYNVLAVRLAGHGTSPCDLATRSHEDWLESVRHARDILSAFATEIIIMGNSTGGVLGLHLAAERDAEKVSGVATVCAPTRVRSRGMHFVGIAMRLAPLIRLVAPRLARAMTYRPSDTPYGGSNYRSIPVASLVELKALMKESREGLPKVNVPVLVVQSRHDDVVDPDSATQLMAALGTTEKELIWIETDNHHIFRENAHDTWSLLDDFLTQHTTQGPI